MYDTLNKAISHLFGATIIRRMPVSGGDINDAYRLDLSSGDTVFIKYQPGVEPDFFVGEKNGLIAMRQAGADTPDVLGMGKEKGGAFLLLSFIKSKQRNAAYWPDLGHMLATMHRAPTASLVPKKKYGFYADNYAGRTRQINTPNDSWVDFFRTARLGPFIKMVEHYFSPADRKRAQYLLDHLDKYLPEPAFPSVLHGDLWGGNVMSDENGSPILLDPAVYVGHHEIDLGMTELFGRFPQSFYDAYYEIIPYEPGYEERKDLYNLYHLLNHLKLFGTGYLSPVVSIIRYYAG